MKKLLILFLYFVGFFTAKGQKTFSEDIWSAQLNSYQLNATFLINDKGEKNLERINFLAKDQQYSSLVSFIGLFYGSPNDCIEWFKKLIEVVNNEEVGTSVTLEKQNITVQKTMGIKYLSISEFNGGYGFRTITKGNLEAGLKTLQKWLSNKGIDLNNDVESKKISETEKPKKNESVADELLKLKKLMDDGVLTKEEFEAQKRKLLEQ